MKFNNLSTDLDIFESISNFGNQGGMPSYYEDEGKFKFPKLLKTLSHLGMRYDDDVLKNMKAIPLDKTLIPQEYQQDFNIYQSLRDVYSQTQEKKNFFNTDIKQKLTTLRKMSLQDILEDILDTMTNECIVYDSNNTYICDPFVDSSVLQALNEHSAEEIKNAVDKAFYKVYSLLNFKRGKAWYKFKKWLIEGTLAFEILYDDIKFPKNITGIVEIDPYTLTKVVKDGVTYWILNKGIMGKERVLIDAQIIYVKYEDEDCSSRVSYLERLIRPYNIYRIIEQAQIIWTVTQASFKTVFTIPVGGMNRAKGAQTLNSAMNRYKEDIQFNLESGELAINGKMNQIFNQEYWLPENSNGKPTIETLTDGGPSIADNEQLRFFSGLIYKASKIPNNRFDNENQQSWFGTDASQYMRDEIKFGREVSRMRCIWEQIIIKPIQIQLTLSIPNIKADKRVLDAIQLHWLSNNQFEEMMEIELKQKRSEFITAMKELTVIGEDGQERQAFSTRFLIHKYLRMPQADIDLNEKFLKEEQEAIRKAGASQPTAQGGGGAPEEEPEINFGGEEENAPQGGEEMPQGGEEENAPQGGSEGGITPEMLGDVQPESESTLTP